MKNIGVLPKGILSEATCCAQTRLFLPVQASESL